MDYLLHKNPKCTLCWNNSKDEVLEFAQIIFFLVVSLIIYVKAAPHFHEISEPCRRWTEI